MFKLHGLLEMKLDDHKHSNLAEPSISTNDLEALFKTLDIVGVSALWVDKDFQHYKYNKTNKFIDESVKNNKGNWVPYVDLIHQIYLNNGIHSHETESRNFQANWLERLKELQETPHVPSEDSVVLSSSGKQFTSRRVFMADGSMLVVSFEYTDILRRDDLVKIAFNISKSGALCYSLESEEFFIESPYLERILNPEELSAVRKQGMFPIIHPSDVESAREIFLRSLRSSVPLSKNIRMKTQKHGNLWFKFTGRLAKINDAVTKHHILTFEDITEELKVQENLRNSIKKSDDALKERLDFIAKLSHELKTPMNAIVGLSDALLYEETSETVKSKLELIQLSSENLVSMLDDTLNHAKLQTANATLDLKFTNPKKIVSDICKLWEHQALKQGTIIRFHADSKLPPSIKMDASRVGQCLNNLISNASKFTEYGQIDVVLKPHQAPNRPPQLAIAVRDTGIGMTKEQQNRIFEAYKQANASISSRYGGTGLGMSITKDLVELMGGKISVSSKEGQGTLFLIILPMDTPKVETLAVQTAETAKPAVSEKAVTPSENIAAQALPDQQEAIQHINRPEPQSAKPVTAPHSNLSSTKPAPSTNKVSISPSQRLIAKSSIDASAMEKLNILVVDDNETNHIVMTSLLDNVVGQIYSAYNGQEALDVLEVEHVDVVLMDIHMPIMDGIEATIAIRSSGASYSDVRIIALTADPQYQQQRLCVNIGMDEAMAKPVKLVDLIETIQRTLDRPVNSLSKAG